MLKSTCLSLAGAAALVFAATDVAAQCGNSGSGGGANAGGAGPRDIVDTAIGAGSFETLVTAVKAAGLVDTLKGKGPFTVFAPTDEAFAKLPKGTVAKLLLPENRHQLIDILKYHVVSGRLAASKVSKRSGAISLLGQRLDVTVASNEVRIDSAKVIKADIECTNGIIHVIDRVILPSSKTIVATAASSEMFTTLVKAVKAAHLVDALSGKGPFTVLAPTNEAFAKLPAGTLESLLLPENRGKLVAILKLHVIPARVYAADAVRAGSANTLLQGSTVDFGIQDGRLTVNGARIVGTDIDASNGVVHVIDRVLLP